MRIPRTLFGLCLVLAVSVAAFPIAHAADAKAGAPKGGAIYVQLSSKMTQKATAAPALVTMESNDGAAGIQHEASKPSEIVIKTPGVYFMIAAAQMGKTSGTNTEFMDLWLRKNGKDVDNTNTRQSISATGETTVLVSQGIMELKANDVISVAFSASSADKGLSLIALTPKGEPAIPSIIFSLYKVN
jgi:hypothetical protein